MDRCEPTTYGSGNQKHGPGRRPCHTHTHTYEHTRTKELLGARQKVCVCVCVCRARLTFPSFCEQMFEQRLPMSLAQFLLSLKLSL